MGIKLFILLQNVIFKEYILCQYVFVTPCYWTRSDYTIQLYVLCSLICTVQADLNKYVFSAYFHRLNYFTIELSSILSKGVAYNYFFHFYYQVQDLIMSDFCVGWQLLMSACHLLQEGTLYLSLPSVVRSLYGRAAVKSRGKNMLSRIINLVLLKCNNLKVKIDVYRI